MAGPFGAYLKALRHQRGLTLKQVEEQTQVSNTYLSQMEQGKRGVPRARILKQLASAYGVSVADLIDASEGGLKGKPVPEPSSEPDVSFVVQGYQRLSKANRVFFCEYLQFLLKKKRP